MENNKIIVILGATSSGKSEAAIRLAKKYNGEIISADSRQVYREMDIGTGKVSQDQTHPHPTLSPWERGLKNEGKIKIYYSEEIPHYLIDIANPKQEYNVSHFKKDAQKIIEDILKRGKLPIVCGGTGFWIKTVVDNVIFPEVKPNKELRKKLEAISAEKLFTMLQKLDPERAINIDSKNKVRLIRAIEICKVIGKVPLLKSNSSSEKSLPAGRQGQGEGEKSYEFFQIGIDIPKEKLYENIKKRLEKRFEQGMIEEVEKLRKQNLSWKKIQSFGLGYYWIPLYLQKKLDKKELFEKIYQAEKNYAKRQLTWFRKDKRITWVKEYREIEKEVEKFLK